MAGYRLTRAAEQDLRDIYRIGVEHFGRDAAERYLGGLADAFEIIAENPRLARERTEYRPPVRMHRHGSHIVVYVIEPVGVLIVRVRHGRENWHDEPF